MDYASDENSFKVPICNRIPTLKDLETSQQHKFDITIGKNIKIIRSDYLHMYNNVDRLPRKFKKEYRFFKYCIVSVCLSFVLGLFIGILLTGTNWEPEKNPRQLNDTKHENILSRNLNSLKDTRNNIQESGKNIKFSSVMFVGKNVYTKDETDTYPKGLTEDMKNILKDNKEINQSMDLLNKTEFTVTDKTILFDNVYWGPTIENSMPQAYGLSSAEKWEKYVNESEIVSMENGCGRMQNRLVTFKDGTKACVRYRQNTDQIQGEIFSFYFAKLINLNNLAPSVVKIVDVKERLWKNVADDVAAAQWNNNRAVVLTQFIPSLEPAKIPEVFKPVNRHLNKHDVLEISLKEDDSPGTSKQELLAKLKSKNVKMNKESLQNFDQINLVLKKKTTDLFVELAQWSDLIIFDYLIANLDRIVNNLFNFQWNINIMNGPAHNLARKMDSGLLLFLDNESGLLHGYRLLQKYNIYHRAMLDNLCVFRKSTVDSLKTLYSSNVGTLLSTMFHKKNNAVIRDILPSLPEKNAKILHERIGKVLNQVEQCQVKYSNR